MNNLYLKKSHQFNARHILEYFICRKLHHQGEHNDAARTRHTLTSNFPLDTFDAESFFF